MGKLNPNFHIENIGSEADSLNIPRSLAHILSDVAMQIRRVTDNFGTEYDLTGVQCRLLGFVMLMNKNGRCVYQRDIESAFHIRRSSVTSLLQNLEKKGFITRESIKDDARMKKIILSGKGYATAQSLSVKISDFESAIKGFIQEKQYSQTIDILYKISEMLDKY